MASKSNQTWSAEEKAAMKEHAAEVKRSKAAASKDADVQACLDKIAAMAPADRVLAEKVHQIVTAAAPELEVKTWYGMPAWARDGKVVCFFQAAEKFKTRCCTLGFSDEAALDDGLMWPTAYALTGIDKAEEEAIHKLLLRAEG